MPAELVRHRREQLSFGTSHMSHEQLALLQSASLVGSAQTDHHSCASHLTQILLLYACPKVISQSVCMSFSHDEEADL